MSSKLFKYKKQGNNFTLQTKDSQELTEQLRQEHSNLCKSISENEMKKQLIEDKLRELSIKFNSFFQSSDQPVVPHLVFKQPDDPIYDDSITNQEVQQQINNYSEFLPIQNSQPQTITKKELWDYFNYKQDVKDPFNDLDDVNNLKKLAEQFGLKTNNMNKLKHQLKIIFIYLNNQEFPTNWNQLFSQDLFKKLEI